MTGSFTGRGFCKYWDRLKHSTHRSVARIAEEFCFLFALGGSAKRGDLSIELISTPPCFSFHLPNSHFRIPLLSVLFFSTFRIPTSEFQSFPPSPSVVFHNPQSEIPLPQSRHSITRKSILRFNARPAAVLFEAAILGGSMVTFLQKASFVTIRLKDPRTTKYSFESFPCFS